VRSRLVLVLSVLGLLTVTLFAVPLAVAVAQSRTSEFALSRGADLERFGALAAPYVRGEDPGNLFGELDTYTGLYGEPVGVVSTRGAPTYPAGFGEGAPEVGAAVARALRNQPDVLTGWLTPWSQGQVVFATATGTDAQITGAVVMLASTDAVRAAIGRAWTAIAVGWVLAMAALVAFAVGVSTWILRPLGRLSTGMRGLVSVLPHTGGGHDDQLLPIAARSGPPELRAVSHTFALMAGQVRRSAEAQRRLVGDTAHQLRNPLAALQLRLEALEGRVDADAEAGYRRAMGEVERLGGILDALLDLSRAEVPSAIGGPRRTVCRPADVVADRVANWGGSAELAGVVLRRSEPDASGDGLVARFDGDDLAQVLDVACKYAGAGSEVTVSVGRAPDPDGPAVRVTVSDGGRGVAEPEVGRLAERFYRGGSSTGSRGTGLGLSIVEALVVAGNGRFGLEPTEGGGLTAVVDLPEGDAATAPPSALDRSGAGVRAP
jgi:signal transduction histidine kinase